MLDNIKTPLFKTIEEDVQVYNIDGNEDIDVEVSLDTVMEESLTKVVELPKSIFLSSMITIRNLARKKWQFWLCMCIISQFFICINVFGIYT